MFIEPSNCILRNTSESIVGVDSQDAIAFTPFQQQRPVQLELISKTRRVVPQQEGYAEEKSPSLLLLEKFEKGCYHRVSHYSNCYQSKMTFGIFIPSSYTNDPNQNNPVLLFLGVAGGLTNFLVSKAGQCAFEAAERQVSHVLMQYSYPPKVICNPLSDLYM
jgi:hypothetical protein